MYDRGENEALSTEVLIPASTGAYDEAHRALPLAYFVLTSLIY